MAEIPLWDVERIILIGQVYLSAFSSARGCHLWPLADELGEEAVFIAWLLKNDHLKNNRNARFPTGNRFLSRLTDGSDFVGRTWTMLGIGFNLR